MTSAIASCPTWLMPTPPPPPPSGREREILTAAAPLIHTRIQLLRESRDMLAFLFVSDEGLAVDDGAVTALKDSAPRVLDAAIEALEGVGADQWCAGALQGALRTAIVDWLGIKPRLAFGPLRVAVTGRRVSPPLFESMEILGPASSLNRLRALRARLGPAPLALG